MDENVANIQCGVRILLLDSDSSRGKERGQVKAQEQEKSPALVLILQEMRNKKKITSTKSGLRKQLRWLAESNARANDLILEISLVPL